MIETITPVVHGGSRKKYWSAVSLHVLGATLSASVFGALMGLAGRLFGAPWGNAGLAVLALVATLYLFRETLRVPIPLPEARRQVPEWWRSFFSPAVAAFLYGLGLGIGSLTFLSFSTYLVVVAGALLSGSPLVGGVVGGAFGLSRALAVAQTARLGDQDEVMRHVERIEDLGAGRAPRIVNAAALGLVTLAALA